MVNKGRTLGNLKRDISNTIGGNFALLVKEEIRKDSVIKVKLERGSFKDSFGYWTVGVKLLHI